MAFLRGEGKNNSQYGLKDMYKMYKKYSSSPVSYKVYANVIKEYNERIMNAIIYNGIEYTMPYNLGYIRVQKKKYTPYFLNGKLKTDHLPVDWKRTLDYRRKKYPDLTDEEIANIKDAKIFRHHNDHTNGFSVRFYWDKRLSTVKNQSVYLFKAARTVKENLAKTIKDFGTNNYLE